jgi:hypothetical protein
MGKLLADYYVDLQRKISQFGKIAVSRILGTTSETNGGTKAIRSLEEARILFRAELTAISKILIDKKIVTVDEYTEACCLEMEEQIKVYLETYKDFVKGVEPRSIMYDIAGMRARCNAEGWPP